MDTPEILAFVLAGLGTVLITLTLLALLCSAMGAVFRASAARDRTQPAAPAECDTISPELLAVLTAAAESTLEKPVRVVTIQSKHPRGWALAGRKTHHLSHKLR